MKSFVKALTYELFSALLIGLSVWWQQAIRMDGNIEHGYRLAFFGCFLLACCVMAVAFTIRSLHLKELKPFKSEITFGIFFGIVLIVLMVINFFVYGGLSGSFEESGYTASNIMLLFLSVLPLVGLVYSLIYVLYSKDENASRKKLILFLCVALWVIYILLAVFGITFRTISYEAPVLL